MYATDGFIALLTPLGFIEGERLRIVHFQEDRIKLMVEVYKKSKGNLTRVIDVTNFVLQDLGIPHKEVNAFFNRMVEEHLLTRLPSVTTISGILREDGKKIAQDELASIGEKKPSIRDRIVWASENPIISTVAGGLILTLIVFVIWRVTRINLTDLSADENGKANTTMVKETDGNDAPTTAPLVLAPTTTPLVATSTTAPATLP